MHELVDSLNKKVLPLLSLEPADDCWTSTLKSSALAGPLLSFWQTLCTSFSRAAWLGTALQKLGYAIVVLLFAVLAAKQFASDKEGLAVVVLAAIALRGLGTLLGGKERWRPSAVDALVLLFFATNLISSCASHYPVDSLFGLLKLFVYVMAYFLLVSCFQNGGKRRMVAIVSALILGGLAVSLYGLYQYKIGVAPLATWEDPTVEDKATRIFSTLGNPNLLAGYLVPLVPFAFALSGIALSAKGPWRWLSIPLIAAALIITVATILTGARGGYVGLLCEAAAIITATAVWLWLKKPHLRMLVAVSIVALPLVAILAVHFAPSSFEHRFLSIFAGSEHSSNAYRLNVWRSSLNMFKDNWWLGIGTGNKTFRLAYGLYMKSSFDALGTYCVPLEIAVETGIPGVIAFFLLITACLARAHQRFWTSDNMPVRILALASAAAIIGMMSHGLVDTVFYRPQVQFIFWLAISILVTLPTESRKQPDS